MAVSFAGIDLVLPDDRMQEYLDRFLPLDWSTLFALGPRGLSDHRAGSRWLTRTNVGLPTPSWTPPPEKLRLNALYWPTGASRFGFFLGVVAEEDLDKIIANFDSGDPQSGILRLDAEGAGGRGGTVKVQMNLLPPRPISRPDRGKRAWLLPLVDDRYFWQFKDFGEESVSSSTTWAQLFTTLGASVRFSSAQMPAVTVPSAYVRPDSVEFTRRYYSAAMLLDAAAASVGMRVVLDIDADITHRVLNWSLSDERYLANLKDSDDYQYAEIAGGPTVDNKTEKFGLSYVPSIVQVVFPKWLPGIPSIDQSTVDDTYVLTANATSFGFTSDQVIALTKTFFSSCRADFKSEAATPDNLSELQTLRTQIAEDYYLSLKRHYDYTFAGLAPWQPTGYDDWIIYYCGSRCGAMSDLVGDYMGQTRVISYPYNFGVEELLHESSLAATSRHRNEIHQLFPFQLTGTLAAGGSVSGKDIMPDGTTPGVAHTYFDSFWGTVTGASGDKGWWYWNGTSRYIFVVEC